MTPIITQGNPKFTRFYTLTDTNNNVRCITYYTPQDKERKKNICLKQNEIIVLTQWGANNTWHCSLFISVGTDYEVTKKRQTIPIEPTLRGKHVTAT